MDGANVDSRILGQDPNNQISAAEGLNCGAGGSECECQSITSHLVRKENSSGDQTPRPNCENLLLLNSASQFPNASFMTEAFFPTALSDSRPDLLRTSCQNLKLKTLSEIEKGRVWQCRRRFGGGAFETMVCWAHSRVCSAGCVLCWSSMSP